MGVCLLLHRWDVSENRALFLAWLSRHPEQEGKTFNDVLHSCCCTKHTHVRCYVNNLTGIAEHSS